MTRITLDLDDCKPRKLESIARLLKAAMPQCIVKYRISASGSGGHIIVHNADRYFTRAEMLNIRLLFDHYRRLVLDVMNDSILPTGILFTRKRSLTGSWVKDAGIWHIA